MPGVLPLASRSACPAFPNRNDMRLFKILDEWGITPYQNFLWNLPKNGKPGAWQKKIQGKLVACENGYHLLREQDLMYWLNAGPAIYEAAYTGELVVSDIKIIVRNARLIQRIDNWNKRTNRLFAADCAEHVLHLYEKKNPWLFAPRLAIQAARDFANGKISREELASAEFTARDAAWAAIGVAVLTSAEDAVWASAWASAESAARNAAGGTAGSTARTARDAAGYAAWSTAKGAECEWQTARLMQYLDGEVA